MSNQLKQVSGGIDPQTYKVTIKASGCYWETVVTGVVNIQKFLANQGFLELSPEKLGQLIPYLFNFAVSNLDTFEIEFKTQNAIAKIEKNPPD